MSGTDKLLGIVAKAFASDGMPEKGMKLLLDEMSSVLEEDQGVILGAFVGCWQLPPSIHVRGTIFQTQFWQLVSL